MAIEDAIAIWKAGVAAVDPRKLVEEEFIHRDERNNHKLDRADRILVVGAGKAGGSMASGLESALAKYSTKIAGIVNVPEGTVGTCRKIKLHAARPEGRNFPTREGVIGSEAMIDILRSASEHDCAFCLISGGGSALLPAPIDGVTLEEKQEITRSLHQCGARIDEMNCVRKHLSRVKGGRLAAVFRGHSLESFILSDVIGDSVDVIASGPTVPDQTTFRDALAVIDRYQLRQDCPQSILRHFEKGIAGYLAENPRAFGEHVSHVILGNNQKALQASRLHSRGLGYHTKSLNSDWSGEAAAAACRIARILSESHKRPACILFGGETTVTLDTNPGKGGRNQEFVLATLCELGIDGMKDVTILSGGTDGEDGPTDAAGAIGTRETLLRARALNLNPNDFLARHDSYHFFEATDGLFKTGLTGTNVMDLGVILLN